MVSVYHQDFQKVYQSVMSEHRDSTERLKKQLREDCGKGKGRSERGDCDTSIEEHSPSKAIFEIPIEMQLLKEVADSDVQVNIFSSSKSFIYEVPVEMHEIFEVPIELNQIFELPIELNKIFEVPVELNTREVF
jgi:hypothetical protein